MANPALAPDITPEKRYIGRLKHKQQDAIYNLSEAVDAAQIYYRQAFPNAVPIGREKIRALYIFLFDLIIHSVDNGAVVSFLNFGKFKRVFTPGSVIQEHISGQRTHRRAHYRCIFNPSTRFKKLMNTDGEESQELFAENANTLDTLDKEAREKDADESLKKELAAKWAVPVSVFDELQQNKDS